MGKFKDLSNSVFGDLTVISRADNYVSPKGQNQTRWLCKCSCGNDSLKTTSELKSKTITKSCGCKTPKRKLERSSLKSGQKFNNLLIVTDEYLANHGRSVVVCQCDCGSPPFEVRVASLLSGNTKSCGCFKLETNKQLNTTHGMSKTKIYKNYHGMLQRCYNPEHKHFEKYGGRGIVVTEDSWLEDSYGFVNFYNDMGDPPEGFTLERKDVNKGYCKDNCIWASRSIQGFNRRTSELNSSGRLGVYWYESRSRYVVKITKENQEYWGGQFKDFDKACKAATELEVKLFGFSRESQ